MQHLPLPKVLTAVAQDSLPNLLALRRCCQSSPCRQVQAQEVTPCTSTLACQTAACATTFAVDGAKYRFKRLFFIVRAYFLTHADLQDHQYLQVLCGSHKRQRTGHTELSGVG